MNHFINKVLFILNILIHTSYSDKETKKTRLFYNESITHNSTTNSTSTIDENASLFLVEKYCFPLIIIIGTISNSLTFLVMRRKKMRNQSTCFYMAVLAIADEMVLLVGCLNFWLYAYTGYSFVLLSVFACKVACMALYATTHFSVWIVVIMTIERFIAVALPLQANRLCTVKRAKIATAILALIIIIINFHFIFTHSLIEGD
jgi:hypothetical protein